MCYSFIYSKILMEKFMSAVGSGFKIDTSGLNDSLDSAKQAFQKVTDLITGNIKKHDTIHENVVTAFDAIPKEEDPLDDNNFNTIVESLVTGDDNLTTDATNNIKTYLLEQMGYKSDTKFSELSEEEIATFLENLTQIISAFSGDNNDLSLEEFQTVLAANGFSGESTESTQSTEKKT